MSTNSTGATTPNAIVTANLSGIPAKVKQTGPATGYPAGYFAVDVVIPSGAPSGDFVPIQIAAADMTSQPGVTISIR